jgi:hypothetical protein
MNTTTAERATPEDELTRVLRWRLVQLAQAGFAPDEATEIAVRLDIDLHEAIGLAARGCPPATALRILL